MYYIDITAVEHRESKILILFENHHTGFYKWKLPNKAVQFDKVKSALESFP